MLDQGQEAELDVPKKGFTKDKEVVGCENSISQSDKNLCKVIPHARDLVQDMYTSTTKKSSKSPDSLPNINPRLEKVVSNIEDREAWPSISEVVKNPGRFKRVKECSMVIKSGQENPASRQGKEMLVLYLILVPPRVVG